MKTNFSFSHNLFTTVIKNKNHQCSKIFTIKKIKRNLLLTSPYLLKFLPYEKEGKDQIKINEKELDQFIMDFNLNVLVNDLVLVEKYNVKSSINFNSFNQNYTSFKKTLFFQNLTRKTKIDSVLKKCKAKFIKAFQEVLNKLLKDYSIFYRLPRSFISDINIDSNKKYLNMTITQIFESFNIQVDFTDIKSILSQKGIALLKKIMNQTYKSLYEQYINSKRFQIDCKKVCKKEGKKFELLFIYVSKIFIDYYSFSKGNKIRRDKDIVINIKSEL